MAERQKSAIIAFLGNAYHDSRVVNLIDSLEQQNINTTTISFDWKTPNFKTKLGKTSVYKLDKSHSSLIYYFNFIFLLIRFLLKNKADLYFAEDVQTLPIVYFFSKYNKAKVFYNSREIYSHLTGLRNNILVQKIISRIEKAFIGKVDWILVTGEMDAKYLKDSYSIDNIVVLRNLPKFTDKIQKINLFERLGIPETAKIILYQGVILEGRGILKMVDALKSLQDVHFVVIGEGEFKKHYETIVEKLDYANRIHFLGVINHNELLQFTASADIGIVLIENISISYYYALPNKLFEYIMAEVPVLASNLPQMKNIIDNYNVGLYVDPENESELISSLKSMLDDKIMLDSFKSNCRLAAKELNWENEFSGFQKYLI